MSAMKRNFIFIILLLALFTGQAEAQRRLPGMKSVRFTAEMADGFYSRADRHDAGYAFSLAVATYTKKGNQWVFGCEMLQLLLSLLGFNVGCYRLIGNGKIPKSRLIQKLDSGNRDIYREYVSFRCYRGKVIPGIERRRKEEFELFYIP
jgi:hypothetical protein